MDNNETAVVSVDAEGNVLKCAKGLGMGECGYKMGQQVCGKCGAMVVKMKMVPIEEMVDEDMVDAEMPSDGKKKKKRMKPMMDDMEDDEEEMSDMEEDEEADAPEGAPEMPETPAETEEEMADETEGPMEEEEEDEEDEDEMGMEKMKKMRNRRLASMGMKSEDVGQGGYMCAIERKVYTASDATCEKCPGACVSEKGMPGILEAEGVVEEMFDAKVFDSGFSDIHNVFAIHAERKDGKNIEVIVHAETAEVLGFKVLQDDEATEEKDSSEDVDIVSFIDAADIAVKAIEGEVLAVEADFFEGEDAYAVEIDGFDGKSYDVYVGLDGQILGYDKYEPESSETEDIEAEAAEIALKRAFSEERRMQLAEEGMALPDGSYPIVSEQDLRNAIQAFGRAKDKEKAKAHIMKRAKEMGKEDMIPENWKASEKTSDEISVEEKSVDALDEKAEAEFLSSLVEFQILEAEIDNI